MVIVKRHLQYMKTMEPNKYKILMDGYASENELIDYIGTLTVSGYKYYKEMIGIDNDINRSKGQNNGSN